MQKGDHIVECIPLVKNVWEREGYKEVTAEITVEEMKSELKAKGVEFHHKLGADKVKQLYKENM